LLAEIYYILLLCACILIPLFIFFKRKKRKELQPLDLKGETVLFEESCVSGFPNPAFILGMPAGPWTHHCLTLVCLADRILIKSSYVDPQIKKYERQISYSDIKECRVYNKPKTKHIILSYNVGEGKQEQYVLAIASVEKFVHALWSQNVPLKKIGEKGKNKDIPGE